MGSTWHHCARCRAPLTIPGIWDVASGSQDCPKCGDENILDELTKKSAAKAFQERFEELERKVEQLMNQRIG